MTEVTVPQVIGELEKMLGKDDIKVLPITEDKFGGYGVIVVRPFDGGRETLGYITEHPAGGIAIVDYLRESVTVKPFGSVRKLWEIIDNLRGYLEQPDSKKDVAILMYRPFIISREGENITKKGIGVLITSKDAYVVIDEKALEIKVLFDSYKGLENIVSIDK